MTEAEIEGLLGGSGSKAVLPMADGEGAVAAWTDPGFRGTHESLILKQWRTPDHCIKVGFDADGKAAYAILTTGTMGMTLWQKIRWWLGI